MFTTLFAHAGHSHTNSSTDVMSNLDHCAPLIIGAGIIIVILFLIILYFLMAWQPKTNGQAKPVAKAKTTKAVAKKKTKK